MSLPTTDLEFRADEERKKIQSSLGELKAYWRKERPIKFILHKYLVAIASGTAALGFLTGYGFVGIISRDHKKKANAMERLLTDCLRT